MLETLQLLKHLIVYVLYLFVPWAGANKSKSCEMNLYDDDYEGLNRCTSVSVMYFMEPFVCRFERL